MVGAAGEMENKAISTSNLKLKLTEAELGNNNTLPFNKTYMYILYPSHLGNRSRGKGFVL